MVPRIALTLSRPTERNETALQAYRDRLVEAGAQPIDVHPTSRPPAQFDALLLSGGGDIDPKEYGEADAGVERATVDPDRDALERDLLELAIARGVPVLGICRGFQVLSWRFGGKLEQHVEHHRPKNGPIDPHVVVPAPGSLLEQVCGPGAFRVNSRHHQVVRSAPAGLRPVAHVGEYVEAMEADDGRWILGVQWHPETKNDPLLDEPQAKRIFEAFVRAAKLSPVR